jgi:hypothetical protein
MFGSGICDSNIHMLVRDTSALVRDKLSINLFIYESGPIEEKIEDVLFM